MTELDGVMMEAVSRKKCSRCKEMKDLTADNFPRNKYSKDGFSHWCKACVKDHRLAKKIAKAAAATLDDVD